MTQKAVNGNYWQKAPMARDQLVLIQTTLEDRIPSDHPVRMLDEILQRIDWTDWENTYDRKIGQPPIHPGILCRVLLYAFIRKTRSSRAIEYAIRHSIDFMWLVSGRSIDHATISDFRRKHLTQIKAVHRQMIRTAVEMGVARLSDLCIDGTRIQANANRYKTWTVARVEKLLSELDQQIEKAMAEHENNDSLDELFEDGESADKLPPELADLKARREHMDRILEQLKQMDARRKAEGKDPQTNPAQLPKTDLDARILPNKEGGYAANFTPMCVNEMLNGFIVEADVVIGNIEHTCMTTMVDTVSTEYNVTIDTMMADSAYSPGENLAAMEKQKINLLSPLAEKTCENNPAIRNDPTVPVATEDIHRLPINASSKVFDKQAFVYDEARDCYFCPMGKILSRRSQEQKKLGDRSVLYFIYRCDDCDSCPLLAQCRKNVNAKQGREVKHDEFEDARRRQRAKMKQPESQNLYKARQHFGETPFAVIKACFNMRRFLLRGVDGVRSEFQWACSAFNMQKLIALLSRPRAGHGDLAGKTIACET